MFVMRATGEARHLTRNRQYLLIARLLLLLGLASCGGGGGNSSATASIPPTSSPAPPADSTPPPAAPAPPPADSTPPPVAPAPSVTVADDGPFITVDQFGYLLNQQKIAVLRDPITENSNGYQTSYIRLLARYVQ
jgi:hypothetical protein